MVMTTGPQYWEQRMGILKDYQMENPCERLMVMMTGPQNWEQQMAIPKDSKMMKVSHRGLMMG